MFGGELKPSQARIHFIEAWPEILRPWGLPKAAARIHALLLSENGTLEATTIQEVLELSTGSTSTQLRLLAEAGLVERMKILRTRKVRFGANADPTHIFAALAGIRRAQAYTAVLNLGNTISSTADKQDLHWLNTIRQLQTMAESMDRWLEICSKRDPEWSIKQLDKLIALQHL
jgi:DNA-binding transcriptional regulator GbsR (MarR family)